MRKTLLALLALSIAAAACGKSGPPAGDDDDDDDVVSDDDDDVATGFLRIDAIDPDDGLETVAQLDVLLVGTGFTAATTVEVDGAATGACTVESATALRCDFPSGSAAGRVDVVADDPVTGAFTLTTGYTYTAVLNETDVAAELDYCVIQFPATTTVTHGEATEDLFGQLFEAGETDALSTPAPGFLVEVGFGNDGTDPTADNSWRWFATEPNAGYDFTNNNDEYLGTLVVDDAGTFPFAWRVSKDAGIGYTYCDLDGAGSNLSLSFGADQLGTITSN